MLKVELKDQSGMTIVELVIASSILLIVSLAIATVIFNSSKQSARIQRRAQQQELIQNTALDLRLRPVP